MRIRFQADADLTQAIVAAVVRRLPEADFRTATDAGLAGLHDLDVLAFAAREGRLLVTSDRQTMPTFFGEFITKTESPGVIVARQRLAVGEVLEDLTLIWTASQAEEWTNRIVYLPL
jgi:predicted nuclease of predicted toxin-antitoxin system